jgi:membrane-bound lytic murein transglycosylase D
MPTIRHSSAVLLLMTLVLPGCMLTLPPAGDPPAASPTTETTAAGEPARPGQIAPPTTPSSSYSPFAALSSTSNRDLWQRIGDNFRLPVPENRRVASELEWFRRHPEYLARIQERAQPYLYFITGEVEKRGMPMELVLLPAVESAFQPFSYSHGRASGLWQFIPGTGRRFGLKQNWWYDGRRDVVASTRAALDYLERLNRMFDGDWELALAAYNAGAGNVLKAIRKNRNKGKATDFWSLDLPVETRSYVPRLLALCQVIQEPEKYGLQLTPLPDQPYFAPVDIQAQLDLALAADLADITIEDLYRLNPGFNRWATDPDGPHQLYIPIRQAESFQSKLAQLDPSQRVHWQRHQIKSGESLISIAKQYKTTVALLKEINKLKGNSLRAGKYLLIPMASKDPGEYVLSAEQRQEKILNTPHGGRRIVHVVQPGETLWDIARNYRVSHRALAKWNGMAPRDTLRSGQELVIWIRPEPKVTQAAVPTLLANMEAHPPGGQRSVHYRVRRGDSLYKIADRFNVSVADLKRWNTLPGAYLKPGQKLHLYVDVTEQSL